MSDMNQDGLSRIEELEDLLAEAYQVIGTLASYAGVFDHPAVQKALDNTSEAKMVHEDVLPFDIGPAGSCFECGGPLVPFCAACNGVPDEDTPEMTAEDFAKSKPVSEVMPELIEAAKRLRERKK